MAKDPASSMPSRRNFRWGLTTARPGAGAVARTESPESWDSLSSVPRMLDARTGRKCPRIHPLRVDEGLGHVNSPGIPALDHRSTDGGEPSLSSSKLTTTRSEPVNAAPVAVIPLRRRWPNFWLGHAQVFGHLRNGRLFKPKI